MKIKFTVTLLVLFYALPSSSQEALQGQYNRDFGFNTYFILNEIFESTQTPFSVMYKKYRSENKALRLGFDTSIILDKTSGNDNLTVNDYSNSNLVSLTIVLGKEKQDHLSKSWVWYYGFDVLPSFSYSTAEYYMNDEKLQDYKSYYYSLSGRPFLGIRFDINPRLYVSAEANLSLSYSYFTVKQLSFNPDETIRDTATNRVTLNLSPASGIFLFYRFN